MKNLSVLTKLTMAMLACAVVAVLFLAYSSFSTNLSAWEDRTSREQLEIANNLMKQIDIKLHERQADIQLMSEEELIEEYLAGRRVDEGQLEDRMREITDDTGMWLEADVVDIDGVIVYSNIDKVVGQKIEQYPERARAYDHVMTGDQYNSDVYICEEMEAPTMLFAYPVYDEEKPDEPIIGVVMTHLVWSEIRDVILEGKSPEVVDLYNKEGFEIYAKGKEGQEDVLVVNEADEPSVKIALEKGAGSTIMKSSHLDEDAIVSWASEPGYKDYKGSGWIVVLETPVSEFRQEALGTAFNALLVRIPIVLIAVGIMFLLLKKYFVKPLISIAESTRKFAEGDLSTRIQIESNDEVGKLSSSFNQMAENLDDMYKNMEMKVKERTKSLDESLKQSEKQRIELEDTKSAMLNIMEDLGIANKEIELEKTELEDQKEELKKVNLELDSFVYTASHDLRAPLRAISSFATFLEEDYADRLDEEGRDYLREVKNGADRLNRLINDLLALSRVSRLKNPYEDTDMNELIGSVLERIEFDIKEQNVDLRVEKDLPTVRCDRIKLGEVFVNLINNAIKFSSRLKRNPKIEIGYIDGGKDYKFFVEDNGIGIDPKYHEKIFGIFRRLHTQEEYSGTGAGLSIVKRIIDEHGGSVWVESELGKGSTFWFSIPKNLDKNSGKGGKNSDTKPQDYKEDLSAA